MKEQIEKQAIEKMACDMCTVILNCNEPYKPIPSCHAYQHAKNAYAKGYRKQEWIRVDERLPDGEGDFLVWNKEQKRMEIRFFHRLPPHYPVESHPEIREYFGNYADYKRITHWMPLPEAPKMKGGAK